MANICNYEIQVKGSRKAGLFVYASMPSLDCKELVSMEEEEGQVLLCFTGDCKWSVDYGTVDRMDSMDVESLSEEEIEAKGENCWDISLRAKSAALRCEILAHSWSSDSGYDRVEHYINGKLLAKRMLPYDSEGPQMQNTASSKSGSCGDAVTWVLDDTGKMTISGAGRMADYENGEAPWYICRRALRTVVIQNGITSIGYAAFWKCESLVSVVIPESVTEIGDSAFLGCVFLRRVSMSNHLTSIGSYAFYGCSSLSNMAIPEGATTIGGNAFSCCSGLKTISLPETLTEISHHTLSECSSLTDVALPGNLTAIGDCVFSGCSSLKDVVLPQSLKRIGFDAFRDCSSLTGIILPDGLISLGPSAFSGCVMLRSISIPESLSSMGTDVFAGCRNLKVRLPSDYLQTKDALNASLASIELEANAEDIAYVLLYQKPKSWQKWVERVSSSDPTAVLRHALILLRQNKLVKPAVADRVGSFILAYRSTLPEDEIRQVLDYFSAVSSEVLHRVQESLKASFPEPDVHPTGERADHSSQLQNCSGLTFVITGGVSRFKNRAEFTKYVISQGGKVSGSVSARTSFLINNDAASPSTKNRQAKELGIPILTEEEFIARFGFGE